MKKYLFKHKLMLALTVFFRSVGALLQVFVALILQQIIDTALNQDMNGFISVLLFSICYFIVMTINDYLNKITQFIYIKNTLIDLKEELFKAILHKDYKSFNSENSADYISNLSNDINLVEQNYITPFLEMIGDVIIFVGTTIVLVYINVWVTIVVFLTGLLMFLVPSFFGSIISKRQAKVSDALSKYTINIKDFFSGYEVIRSFGIEKKTTQEFNEINRDTEDIKYSANHIRGISDSISLFLAILTQVAGIAVGGYLVIIGTISVGQVIAVLNLSNGIYGPIMWIVQKVTRIKGMKEVNQKIDNIIKEYNEYTELQEIDLFEQSIEFKDVCFKYNEDRTVLNNLNIKFEKNKKYAIVGKSGSGKTTLLKILMGYFDDYEGKVLIDNYDIKNVDKASLNRLMSIIHQNVYMFDKTILENIILSKEFTDSDIEYAVKNSGINLFLEKMSNGLDTPVGENGNSLSGGQRQRVAIARSIIQKTPIMLLDEGTSALDAKTAYEIEDTLLKINNLTLLTVTHKLIDIILEKYDEIIVVDEGVVVEYGDFETLISNKSYFYDLYHLEQENLIEVL